MFKQLKYRFRAGTLFLLNRETTALDAAKSVRFIYHEENVDSLDILSSAGWKFWIRGKKFGQYFLVNEKLTPYRKKKYRGILALSASRSIASLCGLKSHDKILKDINA